MRDKTGFDLWADTYDEAVLKTELREQYPFAGYKAVLNRINREVMDHKAMSVMDVGIGTGALAQSLYKNGHRITGLDFSNEMIKIARQAMPNAKIIQCDFSNGVPHQLINEKYDFIVSTYALHHLTFEQKKRIIPAFLSKLKSAGKMMIGDVSFQNIAEQNACIAKTGDGWDTDEYYFIIDEIKPMLEALGYTVHFEEMSFCAGVITITS